MKKIPYLLNIYGITATHFYHSLCYFNPEKQHNHQQHTNYKPVPVLTVNVMHYINSIVFLSQAFLNIVTFWTMANYVVSIIFKFKYDHC